MITRSPLVQAGLAATVLLSWNPGFAADDSLAGEARDALGEATVFFRSIATHGGYLWWYAEDMSERAGENSATDSQIWVQPPGTPAVGMAYLRAWQVTQDRHFLDAAKDAGDALAWGQLASGGWDYLIDFDRAGARRWYRRADMGSISQAEAADRRGSSTLDDDNTQSALRFLMAVSAEPSNGPDVRDLRIDASIEYGLKALLRAQYPNGAFPQRFDGTPRNPADFPIQPARNPDTWERTHPDRNYRDCYTFNDNTIGDCLSTVLDAWHRYRNPKYLEAVQRTGDFILLAQLPMPQPAWAQQYNFAMEPMWARRFEPPAVSGGESAGVIRTLVDLYLETGEGRFLQPIPAAVQWYERSQIAPNTWARFYELETNRPLYFTTEYQLVYTDHDLPTHYRFQSDFGVPAALDYYGAVVRSGREAILEARRSRPLTAEQRAGRRAALEPQVRDIIAALDTRGRWVTDGRIECRTFISNVAVLCDYLEATSR